MLNLPEDGATRLKIKESQYSIFYLWTERCSNTKSNS